MEFVGRTDQESINTYVSRVRKCLLDDGSKLAPDEHPPEEAVNMLYKKFVGRFRPETVAMVCPFVSSKVTSKKKRGSRKSTQLSLLSLSPLSSIYRKGLSRATSRVLGRPPSRTRKTGWYLGHTDTSKEIRVTRSITYTKITTNTAICSRNPFSTSCVSSFITVVCLERTRLCSRRQILS